MPYDPRIQDQRGAYTLQGFGALASGLQDFAKKQEEERLKQELIQRDINKSDIIMQHAKGQGLITDDDWHNYVTAAGTKKVDIAQGLAANMVADQSLRQRAYAGTVQNMPGTNQPMGFYPQTGGYQPFPKQAVQPGITTVQPPPGSGIAPQNVLTMPPDSKVIEPPVRPGMQTVAPPPGSNTPPQTVITLPANTSVVKPPDQKALPTFEQYSKELKAASGGDPFEWANASNARQNPDGSVQAELPNKDFPDDPSKNLTIKLNKDQWSKFQTMQQQIVANQNTVTPPPVVGAGNLGPGIGGYKPGFTYSGKMYLGGDPHNPASWSK